jgi:hypothetical protein
MNRHQRRVRNASLKSVPAIAAAIDKIENVEAVGNQLGIVQRQLYQISVLLNMVEEESKLRHKAMIRMFSTVMNVSEADAEAQFERYYQEAQEDANPETDPPVAAEESPSSNPQG